ncbi:MAG: hypothetical protein RSB48_06845, partial [Akkermansia sp.]
MRSASKKQVASIARTRETSLRNEVSLRNDLNEEERQIHQKSAKVSQANFLPQRGTSSSISKQAPLAILFLS